MGSEHIQRRPADGFLFKIVKREFYIEDVSIDPTRDDGDHPTVFPFYIRDRF